MATGSFPTSRLRQAGVSIARIGEIRATYDTWSAGQQRQFRGWIASNPDETIRRTYDPEGAGYIPPDSGGSLTAAQLAASPELRAAFVPSSVTFHDDFTATPPGALGAADSGHMWTVTGSNLPAIAEDGLALSGDGIGAGYAWTDLGAAPAILNASVVFGAGDTGSVAVLLISKGPGLDLNNLGLHYYFDPTGWTLQVRSAGESPFPVLGTGPFAAPLPRDGVTEARVLVSLVGDTVRIVHADGSTSAFTDPRIAANTSGVVAVEVYRTDAAQARPVFTRLWGAGEPPPLPYPTVGDLARVGAAARTALLEATAQHTQALSIGGDGSIDLRSYRTALVNTSATALITVHSDLPVGQSISLRPWGGPVTFTPGTGNLSFEGGSISPGWAQTVTFTRFDYPADEWVLVGRTG
jgi:hypothetical protein